MDNSITVIMVIAKTLKVSFSLVCFDNHCLAILRYSYVGDKAKLALLLDYDGTLAPLAAHPDAAVLPETTKQVVIC